MRVAAATPDTLPLQPVLDLAGADALHRMLLESVGPDGGLSLDGSAVARVSTACLQVLVAAARSARARGGRVMLGSPSAVLSSALDDLGLASEFAAGA